MGTRRTLLACVAASTLIVLHGCGSAPDGQTGASSGSQTSRLPTVGECAGAGGPDGIQQVACDAPDALYRVTSRGDDLTKPYEFCVADKKSDTIFVARQTAICTAKLP